MCLLHVNYLVTHLTPGLSLHLDTDGVIPGRYALQAQYTLVLLPRYRCSVDHILANSLEYPERIQRG